MITCIFLTEHIEDPSKIREIYENEVLNMCSYSTWACLWQWHGISTVFQRRIQSVFPDRVPNNLRESLTYFIQPRQQLQIASVPLHFLWSKMGQTQGHFVPNHFVPLVSRTAMQLAEGINKFILPDIIPTAMMLANNTVSNPNDCFQVPKMNC